MISGYDKSSSYERNNMKRNGGKSYESFEAGSEDAAV